MISDSDLGIKSDAVPENNTGVANTVSARRDAMLWLSCAAEKL